MRPELTAISRTTLPTPVRKAINSGLIAGRILDYGCGRGIVKQLVPNVTNYDPHYFPKKPTGKFDTVLCLYVLNVVPATTRKEVMKGIAYYLKPGGTAIIAVRTPDDIKAARTSTWHKVSDGYVTSHNTYQHGVSDTEMKGLAALVHLQIMFKLDYNTYVLRKP